MRLSIAVTTAATLLIVGCSSQQVASEKSTTERQPAARDRIQVNCTSGGSSRGEFIISMTGGQPGLQFAFDSQAQDPSEYANYIFRGIDRDAATFVNNKNINPRVPMFVRVPKALWPPITGLGAESDVYVQTLNGLGERNPVATWHCTYLNKDF